MLLKLLTSLKAWQRTEMRFKEGLQAVTNMKGSVNLLISWKAFDQSSNNFVKKGLKTRRNNKKLFVQG
jgi:hypothetical protein